MSLARLCTYCTSVLLACGALPAQADWYLDNESSRLSFVTSLNAREAEIQRFLVLHGKVDHAGAARLQVELDSLYSNVPLRDERVRNDLFEIKRFPEARISAQVDLGPIKDLAPGAQVELRLPLTVSLSDQEKSYTAELLATRLDDHRFQVVTLEPLIVHAEDFGLTPGLNALRNAAGKSDIGVSVPVGAVLIFAAR